MAIAQLERDPALLKRVDDFVKNDFPNVADPDEVTGEHFAIFDVYVADTEGVVRKRLRGSKGARPRLDAVLEAVAEVSGRRAPRMHSDFGKIVVTPSRAVKAARTARQEALREAALGGVGVGGGERSGGVGVGSGDFAAPGRGSARGAPAPSVLDARWMWSHDVTRPGDVLKLALMPSIAEGFHVYAHDEPRLSPFTVELELPEGLVLDGPIRHPAGTPTPDPVLETDLSMHSGDIPLPAIVLKGTDAMADGPAEVVVRLSYQACDDAVCLPPAVHELRLPVMLAREGSERGQVYGWQTW